MALIHPEQHDADQKHRRDGQHECAETSFENRGGEVEPALVKESDVEQVETLARPRQRTQHREIPVEQLQQQRNVAHDLDVSGRHARDELIAREPREPDDKAEQRGEEDRDRGQHGGVEQRDHEHVEVAGGFAEIDELLGNLKPGRACEEHARSPCGSAKRAGRGGARASTTMTVTNRRPGKGAQRRARRASQWRARFALPALHSCEASHRNGGAIRRPPSFQSLFWPRERPSRVPSPRCRSKMSL